MPDAFFSTLHQAFMRGGKSTVLKPLGWLIGLTLTGAIGAYRVGAPLWLGNILGLLSIASVGVYLIAYVYFAVTDKDALRSEQYSIQKLAIQKGFVGDSETGYFAIDGKDQNALPAPAGTKHSEDAA